MPCTPRKRSSDLIFWHGRCPYSCCAHAWKLNLTMWPQQNSAKSQHFLLPTLFIESCFVLSFLFSFPSVLLLFFAFLLRVVFVVWWSSRSSAVFLLFSLGVLVFLSFLLLCVSSPLLGCLVLPPLPRACSPRVLLFASVSLSFRLLKIYLARCALAASACDL